jgi:hypothetical protein
MVLDCTWGRAYFIHSVAAGSRANDYTEVNELLQILCKVTCCGLVAKCVNRSVWSQHCS